MFQVQASLNKQQRRHPMTDLFFLGLWLLYSCHYSDVDDDRKNNLPNMKDDSQAVIHNQTWAQDEKKHERTILEILTAVAPTAAGSWGARAAATMPAIRNRPAITTYEISSFKKYNNTQTILKSIHITDFIFFLNELFVWLKAETKILNQQTFGQRVWRVITRFETKTVILN